jgi:hypothetical protein
MPNLSFSRIGLCCKIAGVAFLALNFSATPAKAGFEVVGFQWVAPSESAPAPVPSSAASEPVIIAPSAAAPVPLEPSVSVMPESGQPESLSPVVIQGEPTASAPADLGPQPTVHGFANNVPLAVALRQVLPSGYNFSIDQNVDMGTPVSFKGGKPWRETLREMLQNAGLSMREDNRMIYIGHPAQTLTLPQESSVVVMPPPTPIPPPTSPIGAARGMADNRAQSIQPMSSTYDLERMPVAGVIGRGSAVDTWTAQRSDTLHKVLEDWCRRAGIELDWLAEYDYPLQASVSFTGTFEDAVRSLLAGFEEAHPQPVAELHNNASANQKVLVIETRGNDYND